MSELHPSEDKAALYLLGEMTPVERREFETELANSPELHALLRELEESSVLLAQSSPQMRPPTKVWQAIAKSIATDPGAKKTVPAFWTAWWRQGWAAAAAILFGWLLYAVWVNRGNSPDISKSAISSNPSAAAAVKIDNQPAQKTPGSASANQPAAARQTTPTDPQELLRLRRQVTELQNRVTNLSQFVAQQQALLGESNRIKFFQLTSASAGTGTAPAAQLSPALQRALFLAMARELGWLPPVDASAPGASTGVFVQNGSSLANVDFVDLRPATNGPANAPQPQPNTQGTTHVAPENAPSPNANTIAIPAFTAGNKVVVAVDQSVVPSGTQLNFLNSDQQVIGTTVTGDNPVVVTFPASIGSGVFLTTGNLGAPWSVFQILNSGSAIP